MRHSLHVNPIIFFFFFLIEKTTSSDAELLGAPTQAFLAESDLEENSEGIINMCTNSGRWSKCFAYPVSDSLVLLF